MLSETILTRRLPLLAPRGKRKSSSKPQTGKKGPPPLGASTTLSLPLPSPQSRQQEIVRAR